MKVNFYPPFNPGASPSIVQRAITATVAQAQQLFSVARNMYDTYHTCYKVLKAQLLASINHLYIADLHDDDIEFTAVKTLTIMTHIWTTYGVIDDDQLGENLAVMATPWSTPTPIEILFTQLKECQKFAQKGNVPIIDAAAIRTGIHIIETNSMSRMEG